MNWHPFPWSFETADPPLPPVSSSLPYCHSATAFLMLHSALHSVRPFVQFIIYIAETWGDFRIAL